MRILIAATHQAVVGGVETYLRALLPALVSRGHAVALVFEEPAAPGQSAINDDVPGVPCWHLGDPAALPAAERWRPDICFAQGLAQPAAEAALLDRFAVVLFAHNYHGTCVSGSKCHAFPQARPCSRSFGPACLALYYPRRCGGLNPRTMLRQYGQQRQRRDLLGRYRAILVASRHIKAEYLRHGLPDHRVHLLPLLPAGAEPDAQPPIERSPTGRVLFVGRLTELKGGAYLVRGLEKAKRELGLSLHLTIAGDGPERQGLQRLARHCEVPAEFCGWVGAAQRTELMRNADLLAVPSVWPEPFGLVGLEAACVGLPAVAFAVGGIPDWLRSGVSGELAPGDPPTVGGLATAIARALATPEHHMRLRHGAWAMAGLFTCDRHLAALEALLGSVETEDAHGQGDRTPTAATRAGDMAARPEIAAHMGSFPAPRQPST